MFVLAFVLSFNVLAPSVALYAVSAAVLALIDGLAWGLMARWFDRAELELMHKRQHPDGLFAAHPFAIAHHLIGQWLHGGTDGRA